MLSNRAVFHLLMCMLFYFAHAGCQPHYCKKYSNEENQIDLQAVLQPSTLCSQIPKETTLSILQKFPKLVLYTIILYLPYLEQPRIAFLISTDLNEKIQSCNHSHAKIHMNAENGKFGLINTKILTAKIMISPDSLALPVSVDIIIWL